MAKLTPEACRAARGLLKLGGRELAAEADLSTETIVMYEAGRPPRETTVGAIMAAFEAHGVEITNGDGTGARLLTSAKKKPAKKRQRPHT